MPRCPAGYQRPPLALATRIMATFWWFFSLVVVATYIANLVQVTQAANTVQNPRFTTLADIVNSEVKLGAVRSGATYTTFRLSKVPAFHNAWLKMNADQNNFVPSTKEAVDKVARGNFAYVGVFPYLDYIVSRDCSLVMVGPPITSTQYAFGFPKGSTLRAKVDNAIVKMEREGHLTRLYARWWQSEKKCARSKVTEDMVDPRLASGRGPVVPLTLAQLAGPIIVLIIGFFLAAIVFLIELFYYTKIAVSAHDVDVGH